MTDLSDSIEPFVRWQERLLEQRASLNNLLLGISVAALGYQVNLIFGDEKLCFYGWREQFYFELSTPIIALSIIFGLLMGYTRLIDYHLTTKLSRLRCQDNTRGLKELRKKATKYGRLTKVSFAFQTSTLIIGFMILIGFYVARYANLYY